ncbi:hypothetical protein D3C72_1853540 [compost metagenome]
MQIQVGRCAAVDLLQESQKLLGPMTRGNPSDHLARQNVESRVQTRRSVAFVIVGSTLDLPRT